MSIGLLQLLVILVIIMLLFGAGKLPQVMGDLAKGLKSFRSEMNKDNDQKDK